MIDPAVVPAVVAPLSAWTPATIGVALTGLAGLVGAIGTASGLIIKEIRAKAAIGAAAGDERDRALNRIELLVDGRYGKVLEELAAMKNLLANATGDPQDRARATLAQGDSDAQAERVTLVNATAPPPSGAIPTRKKQP
jgi:hypothetical protein